MKIIACVFEDISKNSIISMLKRQIRAPEEILVCGKEDVRDRCAGDTVVYMGDMGCESEMESVLRMAFKRWSSMDSSERDVCFLLVGDCVLRKDAVDYLRKTYVPGRISTFSSENPYFMRDTHVRRLDPSGCVLISAKFMRSNEGRQDDLFRWISTCPGSKGVALGYWCAKQKIPALHIGATVVYCEPNNRVDMTLIDSTGDYISNMESDIEFN